MCFHNAIIYIYWVDLYSVRMINQAQAHSIPQRSPFQQFYNLCHKSITSCGKRHKTDKCCDLASTARIVYHPPPVLSLQERMSRTRLCGYTPLLTSLFEGSMQTSIKTVVHMQINCTINSCLVSCNRGHTVQPSFTTKLYLPTWQCCMLLN